MYCGSCVKILFWLFRISLETQRKQLRKAFVQEQKEEIKSTYFPPFIERKILEEMAKIYIPLQVVLSCWKLCALISS